MRFRTVEEIDAEILRLQRQQTSTSMTLAEVGRSACLCRDEGGRGVGGSPARVSLMLLWAFPSWSDGGSWDFIPVIQEKRVVKDIDQLKSNRRTLQSLGQCQDQVCRRPSTS